MVRNKQKPKLVIAGPGSGKTHNMVEEILKCIPLLKPNRILAVVTYTNAATNSIREELNRRVEIPPNVFIGTTYNFFNRFILIPFAALFGKISEDKIFLEIDLKRKAKKIAKAKGDDSHKNIAIVRNKLLSGLLKKGIVPFNAIAKISAELITDNPRIRIILGMRIQYLFVDEFQDADNSQYKVLDAIIHEGRTSIYVVGDPEQYIYNFTGSTINFENLPIKKIESKSDVSRECINRRSTEEIVIFINNFNTQIQQYSMRGCVPGSSVYFIDDIDLGKIVSVYRDITRSLEIKDQYVRFYLGFKNETYKNVAKSFGIDSISNESFKPTKILTECLRIISAITGLSRDKIFERLNVNYIGYRKIGIKLLKSNVDNENALFSFVKNNLKLPNSSEVEPKDIFKNFEKLRLDGIKRNKGSELSASIHKAKGLEADSVLVVAQNNSELTKWLETDKENRFKDKTDHCRLGFVAFSRAIEILCIACQEKITDEIKQKLMNFNVKWNDILDRRENEKNGKGTHK